MAAGRTVRNQNADGKSSGVCFATFLLAFPLLLFAFQFYRSGLISYGLNLSIYYSLRKILSKDSSLARAAFAFAFSLHPFVPILHPLQLHMVEVLRFTLEIELYTECHG